MPGVRLGEMACSQHCPVCRSKAHLAVYKLKKYFQIAYCCDNEDCNVSCFKAKQSLVAPKGQYLKCTKSGHKLLGRL